MSDVDSAPEWFQGYPVVSDMRTQLLLQEAFASGDMSDRQAALASARRTITLDDGRWTWWNRLAEVEGSLGDDAAAERYFREALRRYPWSERAWRGLAVAAVQQGDALTLAEANGRLCELGSIWCDQLRRSGSEAATD